MNEILANISAFVGILSPLVTLLIFLVIKRRIMNEAVDIVEEVIERGKGFYAAEKKDFVESLPMLSKNLLGDGLSQKMSELGQASGLSRSMKALEKDLIADGVDQLAPGFGGLAAKYIQKYPMLLPLIKQFAPMFNKNDGQSQQPNVNSTW